MRQEVHEAILRPQNVTGIPKARVGRVHKAHTVLTTIRHQGYGTTATIAAQEDSGTEISQGKSARMQDQA